MEAQGQQERAVLSGTAKAKEEQESDENPPSADNTWNASNTQEQNRRPSVFDVFDGLQASRPSADLSYSPSSLESESRAKKQTVETVNDPSVRNGVVQQQEKTPPRVPNPVHNRNVSWGQNDIFTDGLPPLPRLRKPSQDFYGFQNLQQPDLNSNVQSNDFSIANIDIRRRLNSVGNKLELEDVTQRNPLESEAETYILKVLESRDPTTSRPRSDSEANTTVLSEVPDEALQALVDDAEVDAPSQEDPSALSPRASLESSGATKSTKVLATAKLNRHRRTETMEQKLFGLTTAIGAINSLHNDAYHFVGNTPTSPTVYKETTDPLLSSVTEEPTSSGDMFGKNASILYRRANAPKKEDNAVQSIGDTNIANEDSSLGTASSRWRLLKQALHGDTIANPKKTDEEGVGEEADEEVGIQSDGEPGEENKKLDDRGSNPTGVAADGDEEDTEEEAHVANAIRRDWEIFKEFQDFFSPRRNSIKQYLRSLILYFLLPTISVAAILFHLAGNPPTGIVSSDLPFLNGTLASRDGESINPDKASASWWLLFVCRQAITFSLAKGMELFIVDFLSVRTKATIRLLGPWATLFILQSRGWPFVLFMWGVFNFSMLSGARPFFSHWLYWQDLFDLFNESNPGGNVVDSEWNHRLLAIAVSVSAVVSVKRFWLGLYLGRQTFTRYSDKLASVMKKILLVSEVASLGRDFEKYVLGHTKGSTRAPPSASMFGISGDKLTGFLNSMNDDSSSIGSNSRFRSERSYGTDLNDPDLVIDPEDRHPLTGSLSAGQKTKIIQLLGAWEEPTIAEQSAGRVSVNALLQFRRALACLRTHYPFSGSFGLADTRELCIESAQEVYTRLLLRTPDNSTLTFEILALLSVQRDGTLDHHKIKDLIRLFRPDRDGTLKVLDFVKSVDSVYKELRLLRASVANSSKIDQAFENIFNIVFYAIVITVLLSQLGFDPLALFLSISGVVLGFAFMISTASSKYFEGLLFILVRRPYEIGDGIHVSNIETDTSFTGSAWWTVEDVTLFTTSVVFMFTGERATLSNGSLANSRVINSSRSPEAYLYILLKFPMGVSYDHLQIFNKALEQFFRNRPREWLSYVSFRATRVEADANFVEYIVVGQHRASWADWTALMLSKADLMHFSLELSKKLNIWYRSPPLPVDLSVVSQGGGLNLPGSSPSGPLPSVPNISAPNTSPGSAINANGNLPDLTGLQDMFAPRKVERS